MSKAATTRLMILQKAFELIYANGYQATSIDDIITNTAVTKGAFFYHFPNKDEMGLAMINEVMYPGMHAAMVLPLINATNPILEIYKMMKGLLIENPHFIVKYGCPAINLIEEMSPLNSTFNKALSKLANQWQEAIELTIRNGKAAGKVRKDVNATQTAFFIMSGYGGIRNLGKLYGKDCYGVYLKELKRYLASLQ
ncbi:TetR family transcriptional regulator [Chitinophaga sp. SYP-B3965]|uniref:TetR/AcrR family transcriptional regulator n=1 Tax=Chitinophaga sp. SYP-B3965 TaxID=2663120 RepID=UPI001299D175|nr:TetR/AcrR family transcriptional regulator [Chitinophaga sp. SYP-B3965]MRG48012.1 TetR family transcriptional regulator [Chitinophaga sp. SYP-B3965]